MGYLVIAETMMLIHFGFVVLVTAGGFLAWRWPELLPFHVAAVVWGLIPVGWCPLTEVENWARIHAGGEELSGSGFMDHYLVGPLYSAEQAPTVYAAVGVGILISWMGYWWLQRSGATAASEA